MRLCVAIASFVIVNGFVVPTGRAPTTRTHVTSVFDSADPYSDLVAAYKKVKSVVDDPETSESVSNTVKEVTKSVDKVTKTVEPAVREVTKTIKPAVDEVARSVGPAVDAVKPRFDPVPAGKAPSLAEFVAGRASSGVDSVDIDRVANAKEKLEIMKANFFGIQEDLGKATVSNPAVSSKLSIIKENAVGLKSTLDASSDAVVKSIPTEQASVLMKNLAGSSSQLSKILDSLKFEEYGGWYIAALALAVALSQRNAKENAALDFSMKLDGAKSEASSAAEAAELAAKGAKLASAAANRARQSSSTAVLEATRANVVKVENEMLQKKLQKLQKDYDTAKSAQAQNTKLKKEITQLKKAAKKADKLLAENKELLAQIALLKKGGGAKAPKAKVAKAATSPKAKATKAAPKAKAAKAKAKRAAKKKAAKAKAADTSDMFFAATDTKSSPGPKGSKAPGAPKKSAPVDVGGGNPWGSLAPSSLKRKTVKDLTAYLSERGVTTKGDDGKALKKDLLVEAVQNL